MTFENNSVNNMFKYQFFIGCNDKDSKEDNSEAILQRVQLYFLEQFGFYSMQVMHGAYTHNDKTVITEKTCAIELILDDKLLDIELICATLKELCNQESILVTVDKIRACLY